MRKAKYLRQFVVRAARSAFYFCDKLTPSTPTVCFISYPDVDDNAYALFKAAIHAGHDVHGMRWLVSDVQKTKERLLKRLGSDVAHRCIVVKKNSVVGVLHFLRAQRVYFTHGHYWFAGHSASGNKLVNLWHGMPLKAIGCLDDKTPVDVQASDKTISSAPFFQPLMAAAFGIPLESVGVTGLPRCDSLLAPSSAGESFRRSVAKSARGLVLWLPTYTVANIGEPRNDSTLTLEEVATEFARDMKTVGEVARTRGCHVVLKLHPADFLNTLKLPNIEGVTVVGTGSPWLDELGLYEMLAVSDGLITDISSVCFDYLVTGKPILISRSQEKRYRRQLLFDPAPLFRDLYTVSSWEDAHPFFDAVEAAERRDPRATSEFCSFTDAASSVRVLQFAPLPTPATSRALPRCQS